VGRDGAPAVAQKVPCDPDRKAGLQQTRRSLDSALFFIDEVYFHMKELLTGGCMLRQGIDLVIEGTGVFVSSDGAGKHIKAGAKKVIYLSPLIAFI
jgi:hypothetical protein